MPHRHLVAMLTLAAAVGACATPAPPVVSLADRSCADHPVLGDASTPTLEFGREMSHDLDAGMPCLQSGDGSRSAYAVFALPAAREPYILSITSSPKGETLFSPRAMLLDASGHTQHEIARDRFLAHGTSLYAGVRVNPSEGGRYLLVASDPVSVGDSVSQIVDSVQRTMVFVGTGAVFINTGSDRSVTHVYAHNGTIAVLATPMPP